jgi:copper chaperone
MVTGLHCQSCVRVVSGALTVLPGVGAVEVDLEQVRAALADEGDYVVVS